MVQMWLEPEALSVIRKKQATSGLSFGSPNVLEAGLGKLVTYIAEEYLMERPLTKRTGMPANPSRVA